MLKYIFKFALNFLNFHPKLNRMTWRWLKGGQKELRKIIINELNINRCASVLDICCGYGDFSSCFKENTFYVGTDSNLSSLRFASSKHGLHSNKKFVCMDLRASQFKEASFDNCIFINALHHFSDDELIDFFMKVPSIVRDKILIIDAVSNPRNWLKRKLIENDRGKFIRTFEGQCRLIKKCFIIENSFILELKLLDQTVFICKKN